MSLSVGEPLMQIKFLVRTDALEFLNKELCWLVRLNKYRMLIFSKLFLETGTAG